MQYYLREVRGKKDVVEALAPNEVRRLVVKVLSIDDWALKEKYVTILIIILKRSSKCLFENDTICLVR